MRTRTFNRVGSNIVAAIVACVLATGTAAAGPQVHSGTMAMQAMMRPDRVPASIGFGDMYHMGRWMVSYNYMRMDMGGNRDGADAISAERIVSSVPNRFAGRPMQPPTLRIVPLDMSTEMHLFGLMYMPSARINWMMMVPYVDKEMDHVTFRGAAGTTRLGRFTTSSDGVGDVKAGALIRLYRGHGQHLHVTGAVGFPTGSIEERATVLTPAGTLRSVRMPYPMQLGSGTYDLMPGLTYTARFERASLGAQYSGTIRVDENSEGYSLGDEHRASIWGSFVWAPWLSTSVHLRRSDREVIDGADTMIVGPVQTADPDNTGGERVELGVGLNLLGRGIVRGHRLRVEYLVPVHQRLNGPQLELDSTVAVRYQYMFMN